MDNKLFFIIIIAVVILAGAFFIARQPENTKNIGNALEKADLIKVSQPGPNETVESPLLIKGEARGFWYFEADFPVKLFDANDNLIALAIAQAQGDWMTEEFVPFEVTIEFTKPNTAAGTLILEKDKELV